MKKRAPVMALGKPPVIPQENFQEGVAPSKAFGLKREERSLVAVGEDTYLYRPVMLCVMAVEELVRCPESVAKEYRHIQRHTSPSNVGDMMFPEKHNSAGHKLQGPKNAQGAALVASKWLKAAQKLGYVEYYYESHGPRNWSRGWKITDKGIKAALEWRKHAVGIEWLKDRENYSKAQKAASDRQRANLKRRRKA